jgi:hypothetical protein
VSVDTSAASSTKVAPQAVMHHSAAVVQNSIATAIQNTPGRRPWATRDGGGASMASRRLLHHASPGTASEANSATRQPACSAAVSDSRPISTT